MKERQQWQLIGPGIGIHWPLLDEDISIDGLLRGLSSGESAESHGLDGRETLTIRGLAGELRPRQDVTVELQRTDGSRASLVVTARLDTPVEINYFRNGGILQTVLRKMLA